MKRNPFNPELAAALPAGLFLDPVLDQVRPMTEQEIEAHLKCLAAAREQDQAAATAAINAQIQQQIQANNVRCSFVGRIAMIALQSSCTLEVDGIRVQPNPNDLRPVMVKVTEGIGTVAKPLIDFFTHFIPKPAAAAPQGKAEQPGAEQGKQEQGKQEQGRTENEPTN